MLEDEEWNSIRNDDEWETENDENKDKDKEGKDAFEEGIIDNDILFDKDGNILKEEGVIERLEIIEYHINKLRKRLNMFTTFASILYIGQKWKWRS